MINIDNIIAVPMYHEDLDYREEPYLSIFSESNMLNMNAATIVIMGIETDIIREIILSLKSYEYGDNISMRILDLNGEEILEFKTDLGGRNSEIIREFMTVAQINSILNILDQGVRMDKEYLVYNNGNMNVRNISL